LDSTLPYIGVAIDLSKGDTCGDGGNYALKLNIKCNLDMNKGEVNILDSGVFNPDKTCSNTLNIETKEACVDQNLYEIWGFIKANSFIFGAVLIAIGLFAVFLGNKMIVVTIFLVTTIAVMTVVFIVMFQFIIPSGANHAIIWVVLGISAAVGLLLGFLIARF
jgi:hypothetical protein